MRNGPSGPRHLRQIYHMYHMPLSILSLLSIRLRHIKLRSHMKGLLTSTMPT
ncbi:hypothetical protein C349_02611 [Cryptococcus neoformans var. grubii Br795]|uniref:Uncharacterized protein n=1 Tax=Cryptococcus neoformans Tu259-1 TaxID=1230072 RepID=A0A854Q9T5_CRYNE|nr:hypothetical protein C358_02511 [Cryptococcus neoformans var. grubii MW-RSA852]OXG10207.1 hypothetical protein C361_06901 [Cryptococcus neoformans var. grubii Tu259-1]OXG84233.1 hypothetical protein C349_02611 [Cryptococcus neoformans var. grubii Br795]